MEKITGIETKYGVITGRDGIFLDSIFCPSQTELILKGEFNVNGVDKKYEIKFSDIVYFISIELDFDERNPLESFGLVENSQLIERIKKVDYDQKLSTKHRHFYFRTYDTVFEVICTVYELT